MSTLKLAAAFAVLAAPALATGLEIEVVGAYTEGTIKIDLLEDVAPNHVAQITQLAEDGYYDGVYFHRVIDGFMAQTGDGQHGKQVEKWAPKAIGRAGTGASKLPNIKAEFSEIPYERGVVGMARSRDVDSANSQFFIMFDRNDNLDGLYTVVGRVTEGLEILDRIKRGDASTFNVTGEPDVMMKVTVVE
ncbi:peptidylprolyl isomerase [uncultured Shimia sp.]|uniref:peptidylprolyl isomerase n=1 Tax=uncultured Shimia sp. TaxID=573152 RepID=UPI0026243DF4|nr:peptidylprolyl isomerase [uncultured Shimia sp.]